MDVLIKALNKYKFSRLHSSLSAPIVINCVPGAGKSSVIREIIKSDTRFVAFTRGVPDSPDVSGCYIKALPEVLPSDKFVLLDEYTLGDDLPSGVYAAFGDPLQGNTGFNLPADFVCTTSRRFGSATAALLRELGFEIEAAGDDVVQVVDLYTNEPNGVVVYYEDEVGCLLKSHCVDCLNVSDIQGQTYDHVTFVTASNSPSDRASAKPADLVP